MIYVLGDSFCFGWNFLIQKLPNRKELLFSNLLSQRLGIDYKNYSIVGSSNYRLCRLINHLDIHKDDIVIIGWTGYDRLEIGIPKDKLMPNDVIIDYNNLDNLDRFDWRQVFQIVEKTNNLYTRSIYPTMFNNLKDITSPSCRKFVESFFRYASDKSYHEEMFKIMFNSAVHRLKNIGCKFTMFTTWDISISDCNFLNIPEYISYNSNMLDEVRYKKSKLKHVKNNDYNYWTEKEHIQVTDIIYNKLKDVYDIQ